MNRGGNFDNEAENAQSSNRNDNDPTNRNDNLGLRPAMTSPSQTAATATRRRGTVPRDVQIRCLRRCTCTGQTVRAAPVW